MTAQHEAVFNHASNRVNREGMSKIASSAQASMREMASLSFPVQSTRTAEAFTLVSSSSSVPSVSSSSLVCVPAKSNKTSNMRTALSRVRIVFLVLIGLGCQTSESFAFWGRRLSSVASASSTTSSVIQTAGAFTTTVGQQQQQQRQQEEHEQASVTLEEVVEKSDAATESSTTIEVDVVDDVKEDDVVDDDSSPERGKQIPEIGSITAEDLYHTYQQVEHDYQAKAFGSTEWKVLNQKGDVEVAMLQHPSDPACPYVRMKATFPVSVQDCWNFLMVSEWNRTMPKMDPFFESVSTYGEYDIPDQEVSMLLCRKCTKRILAFGKRDLVFVSVQDTPLEDGTWVSGSVSVVTPSIPRQEGYTRAFQDSIAFYKPLENNTKTEVTIVCRIDLNDSGANGGGGNIPMWLYVKTIGITGAQSVMRMRDSLVEDQEERRQQLALEEEQRQQQLQKELEHQKEAEVKAAVSETPKPKHRRRGWFGRGKRNQENDDR